MKRREPLKKLAGRIDRDSPVPYYAQLKEAIRERIEHGNWRPGDLIPGEPELCRLFEVSRTVVRQALKDLTYEGLVVRQKGKGTFVAAPKFTESAVQELSGFFDDMLDLGLRPFSKVLKQAVIPASAKVAARLNVEPGTPVIEITRLRFIHDDPMVLVTTYVPYELCPSLAEADLSHRSLYEFLETEGGLTLARGRRTIEAVPADEYEARQLGLDKGAPLILLDSVSYLKDDTPVEYYRALHRGDRSRFEVELVRVQERRRSQRSRGRGGRQLPPGGGSVVADRN